jgi:hypothetical protein
VESDEAVAPVVDTEAQLLRQERRYQQKRDSIRRLQEALAREEEEEEEIRNEYINMLNPVQARVFNDVLNNDNVDTYLSDVITERQRTTRPRTWADYNVNTQNI